MNNMFLVNLHRHGQGSVDFPRTTATGGEKYSRHYKKAATDPKLAALLFIQRELKHRFDCLVGPDK